MIRPVLVVGVFLELCAAASAVGVRPTAVGVSLREFRITPYRERVQVGSIKFNLRNFGEDGHNFVVISPKGKLVAKTAEIKPGRNQMIVTTLTRPGEYRLLCTIANHAKRGMRSTIIVQQK